MKGPRGAARLWLEGVSREEMERIDGALAPFVSTPSLPDFIVTATRDASAELSAEVRPLTPEVPRAAEGLTGVVELLLAVVGVVRLPGVMVLDGARSMVLLSAHAQGLVAAGRWPDASMHHDVWWSGEELAFPGGALRGCHLVVCEERPNLSVPASLGRSSSEELVGALRKAKVPLPADTSQRLSDVTPWRLVYRQPADALAALGELPPTRGDMSPMTAASGAPAVLSAPLAPSLGAPSALRRTRITVGTTQMEIWAQLPQDVQEHLRYLVGDLQCPEPGLDSRPRTEAPEKPPGVGHGIEGPGLPPRPMVFLGGEERRWSAVVSVAGGYYRRTEETPQPLLSTVERVIRYDLPRLEEQLGCFIGTVVTRAQECLWLVGPPGAGKTTLALHLILRQGFSLFSEDLVWVRPSGELAPFPKAMNLRAATWDMFAEELRGRGLRFESQGMPSDGVLSCSAEWGTSISLAPLPAQWIVYLRRLEQKGTDERLRVESTEACAEVLWRARRATQRPVTMDDCAALARRVRYAVLEYRSLEGAASRLAELHRG